MTTTTKPRDYRARDAKRYAEHTDIVKMRAAIAYFRQRKREGEEWEPRPFTKLYIWATEHNLDPIKLITGEQKLSEAST